MNQLQNIISKSLEQFTQECRPKFKGIIGIDLNRMNRINNDNFKKILANHCPFIVKIMNQYRNKININLSNWNGVKKSKKPMVRFRDYFKIARNTFDQQKVKTLAENVWIPIIQTISQYSDLCASQIFSFRCFEIQRFYRGYLSNLILINLINGKIEIPNCKSKYLIPNACYYQFKINNNLLIIQTVNF